MTCPLASPPTVRSDAPFEQILAAARTGHEPALTVLYRRFQPALLGYLRTQRPNDADDLASETWIAAARGLSRFRGDEGDFRRWLFTIGRRRLLDLQREEGRRPRTVAGDAAPPAATVTTPDAETEMLAAAETRLALGRIAALPPEEAEVVVLRVVAGLSAKDVAAITGRTAVGVRVLQHRALKRLAALLDKTVVTLLGSVAM